MATAAVWCLMEDLVFTNNLPWFMMQKYQSARYDHPMGKPCKASRTFFLFDTNDPHSTAPGNSQSIARQTSAGESVGGRSVHVSSFSRLWFCRGPLRPRAFYEYHFYDFSIVILDCWRVAAVVLYAWLNHQASFLAAKWTGDEPSSCKDFLHLVSTTLAGRNETWTGHQVGLVYRGALRCWQSFPGDLHHRTPPPKRWERPGTVGGVATGVVHGTIAVLLWGHAGDS